MPGIKNFTYSTLENEALICARCGYCAKHCPIYQTIGWESSSPRGKISIAKQIFFEDNNCEVTEEFVNHLAQCTLCGACGQECSTDIDTRRLWIQLRERVASMGRAHKGYKTLRKNLTTNKNITTFDNDERLEWSEDLDDAEPLEPRSDAEVCYFVGCVSSFNPQASEIAIAFSEILIAANINFTTLGGEEWCCGFPLLGTGDIEEAKEFMRHNVNQIKELGIHTLVTSCPSCNHTWKHNAGKFLDGYELNIYHATEYVLELIRTEKIQLGELSETITYHDPCDLGRNGGIFDPPRDIIQSIPEVTFVELEHNRLGALCCGGGGNLQSADPELSAAISALRIKEVEKSGATILVSACQQCTKILGMAALEAKVSIKIMDINQLVLKVMEDD